MCCAVHARRSAAPQGGVKTRPHRGVSSINIRPRTSSSPHTVFRNLRHCCPFNRATEIIALSKEYGGYQFADGVFIQTYRQMHWLKLTPSVFQHWPLWLATSSSPQSRFTLI